MNYRNRSEIEETGSWNRNDIKTNESIVRGKDAEHNDQGLRKRISDVPLDSNDHNKME
jgi:hypothetical protein